MKTQAQPQPLTLARNADGPHLIDPAGGVWWPTEAAAAQIEASDDPEAEALRLERAGAGTWMS